MHDPEQRVGTAILHSLPVWGPWAPQMGKELTSLRPEAGLRPFPFL